MLKCIIVDDEQHCIDTLQWQIEKYVPTAQLQKTFTSPEKALKYLATNTIDVLFLDIDMPEMNGFEMLKNIEKINFEIIFTTAYDEFAVKAFKASAIDYLLKPVDKLDLTLAVQKVSDKKKSNHLPAQIEILYNAINNKKEVKERLAVPTLEGLHFIKIKDIIYCISDSNYTHIHLENAKSLLVCKTLKEIEAMLSDGSFIRIHKSHLINYKKIEKFIRGDGGYVVMDDKKSLSVSRNRKEVLLAIFEN